MANLVESPYPNFKDLNGDPLEDGYIFIGEPGLDPISNPQDVYWDSDLTVNAVNIRTKGGYPYKSGSPGRLYTAANYSILVRDKNKRTVYSQLDSVDYINSASGSQISSVATIADLRGIIPDGVNTQISVGGSVSEGDGLMGPMYYWNPTSGAIDNGVSIIQPTAEVGNGRWLWLNTLAPVESENVSSSTTVSLNFKNKIFLVDTALPIVITIPDGDFQGQELQIANRGVSTLEIVGSGIDASTFVSEDSVLLWLGTEWGVFLSASQSVDQSFANEVLVRNWNEVATLNGGFNAIAYSESIGRFVSVGDAAVSNLQYSSDGTGWTTTSINDGDLQGITYSDAQGLFVAVGSAVTDNVQYSSDGITWTPITVTDGDLQAITYSESLDLYVAVGAAVSNNIQYSSDAINWTSITVGSGGFREVTFSETLGLFVVVGDFGIRYSSDGINWTGSSVTGTSFKGVTFSEPLGLFVAVADTASNNIQYSSDGITFNAVTTADGDLQAVAYLDALGYFAAVGIGFTENVQYSLDGINWKTTTAIPDALRAIAASESLIRFVAVSSASVRYTS